MTRALARCMGGKICLHAQGTCTATADRPEPMARPIVTPAEGSIGDAVSAMRKGYKVARSGWNGKGMWLYLVPANSYPAQTEAAAREFGEMVPYQEYVAMKTAQGTVVPWLASQTDLLADDWFVILQDAI